MLLLAGGIGDRVDQLELLPESLALEPVEGADLGLDQVGDREHLRNTAVTDPRAVGGRLNHGLSYQMKQEKMVGRLAVLGTRKSNPGSTERQSYHQPTPAVKRANIFAAKPVQASRAGPGLVPRGWETGQVVDLKLVRL